MKGLLLKDFYTIWKAGRIFIILYIFIAAVSGMNLQNGWSYMGFLDGDDGCADFKHLFL